MRSLHSGCLDLWYPTLWKFCSSAFTSPVSCAWRYSLLFSAINYERLLCRFLEIFLFCILPLSCFSLLELWTLSLYLLCLAWVCPLGLSNRHLQVESPGYFRVRLICFSFFMVIHPWILVQCLKIVVSYILSSFSYVYGWKIVLVGLFCHGCLLDSSKVMEWKFESSVVPNRWFIHNWRDMR